MNIFEFPRFQISYTAARQRLLGALKRVPRDLVRQHQAYRHPLPGPAGEPLELDSIWLANHDHAENVLVLISATHGVEGFAGSAIQSYWLAELAGELEKHPDLGILLIHALNPWGFAWLRRCDHENIDTNRNFTDFGSGQPDNEIYKWFHHALFEQTSAQVGEVLAEGRRRWGVEAFESALTRGQYSHADGLFFGGHKPGWSQSTLESIVASLPLQSARRMAVIDLHTGLGPYGYGELINDHEPGTAGFDLAVDWYGNNACSAVLGESCSAPKDGLHDYFWYRLMGDRGCFVTLEFGTYSADKLMQVTCEEQRYYNRCIGEHTTRSLEADEVKAFTGFFFPRDRVWEELVLFRAGQVIDMALRGILA